MRAIPCLLVALLTACSSYGPGAEYYYPVDELEDGLVYAYESVGPTPFPPHYWYYRSVFGRDSTTLAGTYYDEAFEPRQFINERIVPTGVLRRDLRLYTPTDSTSTQVIAEVLAPAVFSFEDADPDRLLVSAMRWQDAGFSESETPVASDSLLSLSAKRPVYTITLNRHYLRDTVLDVLGQPRDAQLWWVRELIEQDSAGTLSLENRALEIYAQGIGLAYRERAFSDGTVEAYRLTRRLPMTEFEAMAR